MTRLISFAAVLLAFAALAALPAWLESYWIDLLVGVTGFVALASAWALFSGPTRYVSLATVAFYGIGAYTVAVLNEALPFALVLLISAGIGLVVALVVGLATLRLSGVYFVIFSFGLAELVRQLITWFETTITGTLGRYIFVEIDNTGIYRLLLVLAAVTLALRWWIEQSRIGLAVHAIGDDETVARHAGVNVTVIKVLLFALSAVLITLVGAVQSPRYVYVEPSIVFNPTISFLTLIMALVGGANRLWGPVFGAIPLFFLFEWLSVNFPNHYAIFLGLIFIGIVFVIPDGILARISSIGLGLRRAARRDV